MAKKKSPTEGADLIDGDTGPQTEESAGADQDGGQTANPETGAESPDDAGQDRSGAQNPSEESGPQDQVAREGKDRSMWDKMLGRSAAAAKSPREAAREAAKKAERHKAIRNRLMVAALERQAYVLYPYPVDVDAVEVKEVIAEMAAEGLAHDRIRPNLTAAGVAAAQELAET